MANPLFPPKKLQWIGPLALTGAVLGVIAAIIVFSGIINLSARKPHPEGWARILHMVFKRSVAFHEGPPAPADLGSPVRIAAGAAYYGQVCAHCHGGPGLGQNPVALAMHPRPQYLVADLPEAGYSDRELFRIVHDGAKYTAMPAWPANHRPDEIWNLVAFLRAMPSMPPAEFRRLAMPPVNLPSPTMPAGQPRPLPFKQHDDEEPPVNQFAYTWPVYAFGDNFAQRGDLLSTCTGCHGPTGAGGGAIPNITLQDPIYLREALTHFASGQRQSGFMRVIASQLTPAQIDALAKHYASLPRQQTDRGRRVDPLGQSIALQGIASAGIGACAGCHGVDRAAAKAYPLLEGQSAWYIANQMRVFARGGRGGGDQAKDMVAIARRMTPGQLDAVARYYASQAPSPVQSFAAAAPARSAR